MGDQDHRAFIVGQGVEQGPAAVDIEVVGRLIEDQQVRRAHGHQIEQQPCPFAAGEVGDGGFGLVVSQAELSQF